MSHAETRGKAGESSLYISIAIGGKNRAGIRGSIEKLRKSAVRRETVYSDIHRRSSAEDID